MSQHDIMIMDIVIQVTLVIRLPLIQKKEDDVNAEIISVLHDLCFQLL